MQAVLNTTGCIDARCNNKNHIGNGEHFFFKIFYQCLNTRAWQRINNIKTIKCQYPVFPGNGNNICPYRRRHQIQIGHKRFYRQTFFLF